MIHTYAQGGSWLWYGLFGHVLMLVFWAAIIYFVIWLVRNNTNRNGNEDSKKALDVLKERYAKGEITKEQFESIKKDITS
jgi:putative membrane protein